MKDPDVLTIPQAARLCGCSEDKLRHDIQVDPEFAAAIVVPQPGYTRISRPRLLRRIHGEDWRELVEAS